jgi:predicted ATPase/class 3 adenylate cyclase
MSSSLPTGVVTFVFTDIEGSTPMWEREPDAMRQALARHDAILRQAIETQGGTVYKVIGDAIQAAFTLPAAALAAALAAQRELAAATWPTRSPLRVRMGLHTGPAEAVGADYATTHTLNRVARIMAAAHGGQIVLSAEAAELVQGDLPPGVTLRDLGQHRMKGLTRREHLFQLVAPDLLVEFPPLSTLDAVPNNLPVQLTSFIGRERELAEVEGLLASTRLLTLTGSGGTGKTRLSLQSAEQLLPGFADGVWLVELAPLADPAQMLPALAGVLALQAQPGLSLWEVVSNYLRARASLLLLDNCEHLVEACARLAEDLLRACPRMKILASSREALGVPGETAYRVPSLSLPEEHNVTQCESARLFIVRAQAVLSRFAVTPANLPALANICRRLDGIPLALELAAARVRALSLEQIAARLDDRFQLLTGGSRTALPRQQTLRALIDWSYSLLTEPEQVLFRRLAVFAGGWTLEAAEAVCGEKDPAQRTAGLGEGGRTPHLTPAPTAEQVRVVGAGVKDESIHPSEVLDLLTRLVDKSLILMEEQAGAARYHRLETIRQYAREKLFESGEAAALRDRHLEYFGQVAVQAEPQLIGPNLLVWLDRLDADYDNVRAAVEWGLEHDPEAALRLAGDLDMFWMLRGHFEALGWLETALARAEALPPAAGAPASAHSRALAMGGVGVALLAFSQGDMAASMQAATQALAPAEASGEKLILSLAEVQRAIIGSFAHDVAATRAAAEHGLALARELNEPTMMQMHLVMLAWAMGESGDQAAQQALTAEAARMRTRWVSPLMYGPRIFLGLDARWRGDLAAAREHFQEEVRLAHILGLRYGETIGHSELAHIDRMAGDLPAALAGYSRTLVVWKDLGKRPAVANQLECFAFIARAQGQPERAARLLGAAETLREVAGAPMLEYERGEYEREIASLRAALDQPRLDEAWAAGQALTLDQAVAYALDG